jgi:hypothetical protein
MVVARQVVPEGPNDSSQAIYCLGGPRQNPSRRERCDESLLLSAQFADAITLAIGIRTTVSTVPPITHHTVPL